MVPMSSWARSSRSTGVVPKAAETSLGIVMVTEVDLDASQAEHGLGEWSADTKSAAALDQLDEAGVRLFAVVSIQVDVGECDAGRFDHGQLLLVAHIGHRLAEEVDQLSAPRRHPLEERAMRACG